MMERNKYLVNRCCECQTPTHVSTTGKAWCEVCDVTWEIVATKGKHLDESSSDAKGKA